MDDKVSEYLETLAQGQAALKRAAEMMDELSKIVEVGEVFRVNGVIHQVVDNFSDRNYAYRPAYLSRIDITPKKKI